VSAGGLSKTRQWPELAYEEWRDTRDTLHMYTQVVGKLRLALSPFEPEWGNVPLYLSARGLTTSPVPVGLRTFDAEFDLVDHQLLLRTSDGGREQVGLRPVAVADFYREVMAALGRLGVEVAISATPSEVPDPIPFAEDQTHASYDAGAAGRFFQLLSAVGVVFNEHRARFLGRTTPVHFFWGTFDLALTRFSGRPASPPPGADIIVRRSADAEQICGGFWPGHAGFPRPAFYAYAYPKPAGIEKASVAPDGAGWDDDIGEFLLPYDTVRAASDPRRAILDFLESTYEAGAAGLGWSADLVRPRDA
jgi:uncharacterized protein DUF5996